MTGLVPIVLWFAAICIPAAAAQGAAKQVADNDRVTMWDVTWTADMAPIHHEHDFVRVFVTGGNSSKKPGDVEFNREDYAKRAGDGARTIEIELKDHSMAALANTSGYAL